MDTRDSRPWENVCVRGALCSPTIDGVVTTHSSSRLLLQPKAVERWGGTAQHRTTRLLSNNRYRSQRPTVTLTAEVSSCVFRQPFKLQATNDTPRSSWISSRSSGDMI